MVDIAPPNIPHQEAVELKAQGDGRVSGQRKLPGGGDLGTTYDPKTNTLVLNAKYPQASKDAPLQRATAIYEGVSQEQGASFAKAYLADGASPKDTPASYSCRSNFNSVAIQAKVSRQPGLDKMDVTGAAVAANPGLKDLKGTSGAVYGLMVSKPGETIAPVYGRANQVGKMIEQAKVQCGLAP